MDTITEPIPQVPLVKKPRKPRKPIAKKKPAKKGLKVSAVTPPLPTVAPTVEPATQPATEVKLKLVDEHNRDVLAEGRSYGIAFAWGKREGEVVKTVGARSPCKDYLNDQVYSEWTGRPYRAWGYNAKKEGIFEGTDKGYIGFSILPYKHGSKYAMQDKEFEFLNANYPSVQKFLNTLEEKLSVPATQIVKADDNMMIGIVDKFWYEFPYRCSLWSLLVRFAVESFWKEGDIMEAMKKATTADSSTLAVILPKIERLIKGERPKQDYTSTYGWHDAGICSIRF